MTIQEVLNYSVLDKNGIESLALEILKKVNTRIDERIVTEINAESDDVHVPSAAAVYAAVQAAGQGRIVPVTGDIEDIPIAERNPNYLYYQRDDEYDESWTLYIWHEETQSWVTVGNTDIDLSDYWKKTDTEAMRAALGIQDIDTDITSIQSDITNIQSGLTDVTSDVTDVKSDISTVKVDMLQKPNRDDFIIIETPVIKSIIDSAYNTTDPFKYVPATTVAEVNDLIDAAIASGETEVNVKITEDINLKTSDIKSIVVPDGITMEVNLDESTITCDDNAFKVSAGGTLKLVGDGTIIATNKATKAAVTVEAGGALVIDGITIDTTTQGKEGNFAYGIYAKNQADIEIKSGIIRTCYASCIGTNNTTGGSNITISGGALYSDGSYAIYNPAQGTINITGGIVQGINARMGTINISGNAQIISTTLTDADADDLGSNINTTGSIGLGDAIVLIAGSYTDPSGVDIELNIEDNAAVASDYRSAIGVYLFDTKESADVAINIANHKNVYTTDTAFDVIKVYDHDAIAAAATEAGTSYNPIANSTVEIN